MVILKNFKANSYPNIHQDAPNCTIYKNVLEDHTPSPLAKRMERHANFINLVKNMTSPPPIPRCVIP